jgi:hypothetical protein
MIKTCGYPDCESSTEGNTDYCGTHNREMRKAAKIPQGKISPMRLGYLQKVKKWKKGKTCALGFRSSEKCYGAITCHHKKGRVGDLLMDEKYWLPVCLGHHKYIEEHPEEAYRNGWSELRLANEPHEI